ncbi:DUF1330 domain-containing protein [Caballeronia sp. GACF5]|uniref:DUF1330 domain-containing protein n=1 Tax=Caballeronia sp. GACF5 TaxID=2921746 RepID=UPI0020282804|nr:DUF1330 domain-containing protein [Caballeronia sp. GACF5]
MAKGYWVVSYKAIKDAECLRAYAKVAGTALDKADGKILVRGIPEKIYDDGISQLTVVVEFETVDAAIAARESDAYREALAVLGGAVERDFRIAAGE